MNKAILVGRLTKDPELRYTQTGKAVCTFTLAVNRRTKDEADFIPCVAWDKIGSTIAQYVGKGRQLAVEGRIQVRQYQDKQGNNRYATEVIVEGMDFVGSRNDGNTQQGNTQQAPQPSQPYQQGAMFDGTPAPADDDIPF